MSKKPNQASQNQQRDPNQGAQEPKAQPQRDNMAPDTDDEKTPRMNEGDEAPSVRRGALNTQYGSDKSQTGKPGANTGGPDDRSIDNERSTSDDQDTLVSPRGVKQP